MINGKSISDLLLRLYDFPRGKEFHSHVLHVLDQYIPSTISAYAYYSIETRDFVMMEVHNRSGLEMPASDELSEILGGHPFRDYYDDMNAGSVISIVDVLSDYEWKRTGLYQSFYEPLGMLHDTSMRYYYDNIGIIFSFTGAEPLGIEYRRILNLIAPHLPNAHRSYEMQQQGFMSSLPAHSVLFSFDGRVKECPEDAVRLFEVYFPNARRWKNSPVPEHVARWARFERNECSTESCNTSANKLTVHEEESTLKLSITRHPAGFLVMLEETQRLSTRSHMISLGLTEREAEVLAWVAEGKQNSEIAMILEISTATVRKHVENILRKFHCETRGAAVQYAMQGLLN
jgi:DNA-binding CsgD family transcriptional regulator